MPNPLERLAVERVIAAADAVCVPVPPDLRALLKSHGDASYPARTWAEQHPEDDGLGCCWGDVQHGPAGCTCWVPVFDTEQALPRPPAGLVDPGRELPARTPMCGDCAYRKDSPERTDDFMEDVLLDLPAGGSLFWCHEGMRRPARWEHPDGRVMPGSPDDWQPPMGNGIAYRLDGSPALLCGGWAARAVRAGRRPAAARSLPPVGGSGVARGQR